MQPRTPNEVTEINKELEAFLSLWIQRHKLDPAEVMGTLEGTMRALLVAEHAYNHTALAMRIMGRMCSDLFDRTVKDNVHNG